MFGYDPKDKLYKCISCGLIDEKVECGGIYYCPNPFCTVSGSTNWKVDNLPGLIKEKDGYQMTEESYAAWLEKGMAEINKMPYVIGAKIMALPKTRRLIAKLKRRLSERACSV